MSSNSSPSSRPRLMASDRERERERDNEKPIFTSRMQDRQARNKDPYDSHNDLEDDLDPEGRRYDPYGSDTYAATQLRRDAAIKLDSPELVMMLAQSRNDSVPATRHYLTKILCGFTSQLEIDAEKAAEAQKTAAAALKVTAAQAEREAARAAARTGAGSGRKVLSWKRVVGLSDGSGSSSGGSGGGGGGMGGEMGGGSGGGDESRSGSVS